MANRTDTRHKRTYTNGWLLSACSAANADGNFATGRCPRRILAHKAYDHTRYDACYACANYANNACCAFSHDNGNSRLPCTRANDGAAACLHSADLIDGQLHARRVGCACRRCRRQFSTNNAEQYAACCYVNPTTSRSERYNARNNDVDFDIYGGGRSV